MTDKIKAEQVVKVELKKSFESVVNAKPTKTPNQTKNNSTKKGGK